MHGLPHHVDQDLSFQEALGHLVALSNSLRPIIVKAGCLTCTGPLRFIKSLDSAPDDPARAERSEYPMHIFHLGDHSSVVVREVEFQGAHLRTMDGDDYFFFRLDLAVPLRLMHGH